MLPSKDEVKKKRKPRMAEVPSLGMDLTPVEIDGEYYYTVNQFAHMTARTGQTIRYLINNGNRIRRLRAVKIAGKPFVYASEFRMFPFTVCGRSHEVAFFKDIGLMDYVDEKDVGLYLAERQHGAIKDLKKKKKRK